MPVEILQKQPLGKFSFYGIGGPADELIRVGETEDLANLWAETCRKNIPKFVLGSGSNTVFADTGFRGRVFLLTNQTIENSENTWWVSAGVELQKLVEASAAAGFADLQNLSGIPGTVGGAVRGNAGAFGSEIGDVIEQVEFVDETGTIRVLEGKDGQWQYRSSVFKKNPNWCVTRVQMRFKKKDDPEKLSQEVRQLKADRWKKYPPGRSGGSFFKNPEGNYAGKLLEDAGAKGDRIGDIEISDRHANFFLNLGNGKQSDLLQLARKWRDIVAEKWGVTLEPEVMLVDERGDRVEL
ncbi:MAG: UDP-N-acetylmuramate dehydrogenase [Candidatus Gracilibacteria bacterium]|nr:UDP-N-acetylmuramate dehydrogenase [Candidatus Gracilibacteria bacterium]